MSDEIDIHEPEHDHLLDHEFYENEHAVEEEVQPLYDDENGADDVWEDDLD
ncbi:hypothetical protein [Pseudomonas sp. R5(2019)]|uniref:hypothetical protein n=1 Tax=Pseudomonas sp. R5(2019) TaxID=2697566 RepID=UPI001413229B|nr:hypothetical protein [Pseudomonas sp. R5(2019)]